MYVHVSLHDIGLVLSRLFIEARLTGVSAQLHNLPVSIARAACDLLSVEVFENGRERHETASLSLSFFLSRLAD